MNQEEKISGKWWFSDQDPKTAVAGDLFIKDRLLELNGHFEEVKNGIFGGCSQFLDINNKKTILGISRDGTRKFTLEFYDNPFFSIPFSNLAYQADTYSLGHILEGGYFSKYDDLSFGKYNIEFPYLFEWINNSVVTILTTIETKKDKTGLSDYSIKISRPKSIVLFKNDIFKLICTTQVKSMPLFAQKEMNIVQKAYLTIEAINGKIGVMDCFSIVSHFKIFLSIAVGKSLEPISYNAIIPRDGHSDAIKIYPYFLKQTEYPRIHNMDIIFLLKDIKADSQIIFENWFSKKNKYKDVFDIFLFIGNNFNKNLNNQFKDVVSAIEGYVAIKEGKTDSNLQKAIKTLNEYITQKENKVFKGNDYNRIRITRNKLAHIAVKPEDEKHILNNRGKITYFYKLHFLLEYAFLRDIGMSEKLLEKFRKSKSFIS